MYTIPKNDGVFFDLRKSVVYSTVHKHGYYTNLIYYWACGANPSTIKRSCLLQILKLQRYFLKFKFVTPNWASASGGYCERHTEKSWKDDI